MNLALGLRALLLALVCAAFGSAQEASPKGYACPPCGCASDGKTFDTPGTCRDCGMPLSQAPLRVAILIFNGVQIIDYTGPYEMFGAAGFEVFTVATSRASVKTVMGMEVVPRYTFTDAPPADVLVIPGGSVKDAADHAATLAFIKASAARNKVTLSVCNGAFILANTGLLNGLTVTTTRGNIPRLAQRHPELRVVAERRYVDNGRIVTAAGLSAGIDGALHVIEKLKGHELAKQVAYGEEYVWEEGK
ncbi:MAG TPA: DJ-1/PfpI family protein [Holophagaceae bacterium]|nr:DJ-1/PfpI family protein [Holophagaceae bacterium]